MNIPFSPPAPSVRTELYQPTDGGQRIPSLDLLRGVALLGILLMNIPGFGKTEASIYQTVRGPHGLDYWVIIVIHALFANKMRALFSMLFGAGIILFLTRKRDALGMAPPELFIRRQLWLIVFGLVNALVLLWPYDILFQYGIVGILLFPFMRLPARALLICAVVAGLVYGGKAYWNAVEEQQKYAKYQSVVAFEKTHKKVKLTDEQKADKSGWEGLVKSKKFDPKADKAEVVAMRSDYATVWSHLLPKIQQLEAPLFYRMYLWDIVSMMLLGMALFRWGFFSSQLPTRRYGLLCVAGLGIGQGIAWLTMAYGEEQIANFTRYVSTHTLPLDEMLLPFERGFSAIGWASLVLLLYRANVLMWLWKAVGAVGQMAFTNYLMQSVICTLFFYGYGFGYFGDLRVYQLYYVVAEVWLIQLVFSVIWLHYFRFGPLEWLWRSLTYGYRQPMALPPVTSATPALS